MNFELNNEQSMARKMFAAFVEKEVKPLAHDIGEEGRFSVETVEKMKKYGFFGVPYPKELGGQGRDVPTYIMCVKELSKACGTTGVIVSTHTSLCADPIYKYGTKEQKEKYLVPPASGKKIGAFSPTESDAGTDTSGQQTKTVLDGDHYVLNGSKIFITNGGVAGIYVVFIMTDRSKGVRSISALIVEKEFPDFSIGKREKKMGIRSSATTELVFENCVVPKESPLGQEGRGLSVAMTTLDGGRIGIAAQALGIAEGALDETIEYVKERKQFGRPIAAFQNTQFRIADMETKIDVAQLLVYHAAMLKQAGTKFSTEAAVAKLFATETTMAVTTECVQLFGGYGYTRGYPVERMMRDARITGIYEGTGEVQHMVISNALLK